MQNGYEPKGSNDKEYTAPKGGSGEVDNKQSEMDLRMCLATISGYHSDKYSTQLLITKAMDCVTELTSEIEQLKLEDLRKEECINLLNKQVENLSDKWISAKNELPKIGQKVLLLTDDTVQEEIYMYDESDINDWTICQFWSREDVDNNKVLDINDKWQPLPKSTE
jgi:hypothetical protein